MESWIAAHIDLLIFAPSLSSVGWFLAFIGLALLISRQGTSYRRRKGSHDSQNARSHGCKRNHHCSVFVLQQEREKHPEGVYAAHISWSEDIAQCSLQERKNFGADFKQINVRQSTKRLNHIKKGNGGCPHGAASDIDCKMMQELLKIFIKKTCFLVLTEQILVWWFTSCNQLQAPNPKKNRRTITAELCSARLWARLARNFGRDRATIFTCKRPAYKYLTKQTCHQHHVVNAKNVAIPDTSAGWKFLPSAAKSFTLHPRTFEKRHFGFV